jgi:ribosomal protein S18 acetylase RimI-like enzyme
VRNDLHDRDLPRIVVWALSDNERACAFYRRLGGRQIAEVEERIAGTPLRKTAFLFR